MTKKTPATPLPWYCVGTGRIIEHRDDNGSSPVAEIDRLRDAAYIAHACNAYPRLVEALRCVADGERRMQQMAQTLLRELGEAE